MDPESNQASITGSTRRDTASSSSSPSAAQVEQTKVTSSIVGRWGSIPVTSRPHRSESSASDPTQRRWPRPQRQMGSGVPQ